MRSVVDLPEPARHRAEEIAGASGRSLSATIAKRATLGLAQLDRSVHIDVDPRSGFPVLSLGRRITDEEVARALDDE